MPAPPDYIDDLDEPETLVDLLDRVLDIGVSISGDLRISVANVELLYVGLRLVLGSPDRIFAQSPEAPS